MPVKTEFKSEQEIRDIKETGLVSYSIVIDETYRLFKEKNITVKNVKYKPNANGDTVTAIYEIDSDVNTEDLTLCIIWTHSYHKAIRFQCNSAVKHNDNLILINNSSANRSRRPSEVTKYTDEIFDDLKLDISYLEQSIDKYIDFKDTLESASADVEVASTILGMLYVEENLISTSQASVAKDEILNNITNAWDVYLCFAKALSDSNAKLFISDHINLYRFFKDIFTAEQAESKSKPLSLPKIDEGKSVDEQIQEQYNYKSPISSVIFL